MNNVVLVGRLTKEPGLRYIQDTGTAVASFTIAVDRDYKKRDGSKATDFIPVEIMGKPAEYVANYIGKGRLVAIQGAIRFDRYVADDGNNMTYTKVAAKSIQSLESGKKDAQVEECTDDEDVPF